jgi:hypothetical protein
MILDYRADPDHASQYDVLDAATFQPHPNGDIFYADDSRALIRYYKRDDTGNLYWASKGGVPIRCDSPFQSWQIVDGKSVSLPNEHIVLDDGTKVYLDQSEIEVAWEEARCPIRIARKVH